MSESHVPPQNLEAEESVLGAMLLSPRAIEAVSDVITPEDFYRHTHGVIFKTALDLNDQGTPVDAITLSNELERRGIIEEVGGKVRVAELAHLTAGVSNVAHYAQIIHEAAVRRRLIHAGNAIANIGWEGNAELNELLGQAEGELTSALDIRTDSEFEDVGDTAQEYVNQIVKANEAGVNITGLMTRYADLDEYLTGLYPGQLIVLAARPSVGKSALGLNIADNIADRGTPVGFFALEMSKSELTGRSVARLSKVPTNLHRQASKLDQHQINALKTAAHALRGRPLKVDDNPGSTLSEIRGRARRAVRQHKLGLLVVDYLQLVNGDGRRKNDSRQNEVADISRGLKLLAKELNIPILAISQLSRKVDDRPDKRPVLSDLRDSGAIEQDADVVLFLYREELYKIVDPEKARDAELIVAKNRNGDTGTVQLLWFPKRQYFGEPARLAEEKAA